MVQSIFSTTTPTLLADIYYLQLVMKMIVERYFYLLLTIYYLLFAIYYLYCGTGHSSQQKVN